MAPARSKLITNQRSTAFNSARQNGKQELAMALGVCVNQVRMSRWENAVGGHLDKSRTMTVGFTPGKRIKRFNNAEHVFIVPS